MQIKRFIKKHNIVCKISSRKRKKNFLKTISECISKPRDLWKAIKSFPIPNKSGGYIVGVLAENQIVKYDISQI